MNGFIKARLEHTDWPIHQYHRRALVDLNDTAKPVVKMNNIPNAQPERRLERLPDQTKFDLIGVNEFAFHKSSGLDVSGEIRAVSAAWVGGM